ncbi:hypothetical protein [Azospirillum palustre]
MPSGLPARPRSAAPGRSALPTLSAVHASIVAFRSCASPDRLHSKLLAFRRIR